MATDSGEELAIPADDWLHAALRGDRPRLGQLEIEMESSLGPRDIQSRIRAGASLEDVARVAGIPFDRVERFALPVLAEREHIASLAMSSSVRRRGETSGHRHLRVALTEKLLKRGVDIDTLVWDSHRLEDGRWSVSADYRSGESSRTALFIFDVQGRFSVADNDEARWVLGEQSSAKGPQPGRRRPVPSEGDSLDDSEPTLDLSDELALVRVIQGPELTEVSVQGSEVADAEQQSMDADDEGMAPVRVLHPVPEPEPVPDPEPEADAPDEDEESPLDVLASMLRGDRDTEEADPETEVEQASPHYGGLSDASAVPETNNSGWEPGIVVNYPVEPSVEDSSEEDLGVEEPRSKHHHPGGTDTPSAPEPPVEGRDRAEEAAELENESRDVAVAVAVAEGEVAGGAEGEVAAQQEQDPGDRPAPKRKRAAVPSWDDIMFGGPKRSG